MLNFQFMKRFLYSGFVVVMVLSSCKKEDERNPHSGHVTEHFAYVKGIVIDSLSGSPVPGALVYYTNEAFSSGLNGGLYKDTADIAGQYTTTIHWYSGNVYDGPYEDDRPADSSDVYLTVVGAGNTCGFVKFKGALIIENDTIILPVAFVKPYAYISVHLSDTLPMISSTGYLDWYNTVNGNEDAYCIPGGDTVVVKAVCAGLKTNLHGSDSIPFDDSLVVGSGDTAFVNVFY
jgi:hypothetical protein